MLKALALISLLSVVPNTVAVPFGGEQVPLGGIGQGLNTYGDFPGNVISQITPVAKHLLHDAEKLAVKGKETVQKWIENGKEFVLQNGLICKSNLLCSRRILDIESAPFIKTNWCRMLHLLTTISE
jgi:hypothetical protein